MRATTRRTVAALPAAVLMFTLVACGGGSDSGSGSGDSKGAEQQSAQSADGAAGAQDADDKNKVTGAKQEGTEPGPRRWRPPGPRTRGR